MGQRNVARAAFVLLCSAPFGAWADEPDKSGLSVVDSFRISGSFKSGKFDLSIAGRVIGQRSAFSILSKAGSARPYGCEGSGIVSRAGEELVLLPSAQQFKVHCRVAPPEGDSIEFTTTPEVMWAESTVSDGDEHAVDQPNGSRVVTIARHVTAPVEVEEPAPVERPAPEPVPTSASAKYRITLRPGATDFRYEFAVKNPNPMEQPFTVALAAGEVVRSVENVPKPEPVDNRYTFTVQPGDTKVVVSGSLPQTAKHWSPPMERGVQSILIEAHPLLRLTVAEGPRRVSPRESGLSPEYRGAQAFLLAGNDNIGWETKTVEAMESTSFAVPSVTHDYFVNREGDVLGDSSFEIQNTGAPDLTLPMRSRPASASVDGVPMPLTKNAAGDLWTQLSVGAQTIVVQHWQNVARRFGMAWGTLWLPQVQAPVTETAIKIHYPREWTPLIERFRGDTYWSVLERALSPWALVVGAWTWLVCGALMLSNRRRFVLAFAATLSGFLGGWVAALVFACNGVATLAWIRTRRVWIREFFQSGPAIVPAVAVILIIAGIGIAIGTSFSKSTPTTAGAASQVAAQAQTPTPATSGSVICNGLDDDCGAYGDNGGYTARAMSASAAVVGLGSGLSGLASAIPIVAANPETAYRGMPAMTVPPAGATVTTFHSQMLMMDKPSGVEIILISHWLLRLLAILRSLLVVGAILRDRDRLTAGMSRLWSAGHPLLVPARIDVPVAG